MICLNKDLYNLGIQARKHSYLKKQSNITEDYLKSGFHKNGEISFSLAYETAGGISNNYKGYAINETLNAMAIIQNKKILKNNIVFFDHISQTFYKLQHKIDIYEEIDFFKIIKIEANALFTSFEYNPFYNKLKNSDETTWKSYAKNREIVNGSFFWDYDKEKPKENKFSLDGDDIFAYRFGGKYWYSGIGGFTGGFWQNKFIYDVEFSSKIGIGIIFDSIYFETQKLLSSYKIPFYGFVFDFLGVHVTGCIGFELSLYLNKVNFTMPKKIEFYKEIDIKFKMRGSSDDFFKKNPFSFKISDYGNNIDLSETFKTFLNGNYYFVIEVNLDFIIQGEFLKLKAGLSAGGYIVFDLNYKFDFEKCMCPYLYGQIELELGGELEFYFHGILFSRTQKTPNFVVLKQIYPKSCLFQFKKTTEGDPFYFLNETDIKRIIILTPYKIVLNGNDIKSIKLKSYSSFDNKFYTLPNINELKELKYFFHLEKNTIFQYEVMTSSNYLYTSKNFTPQTILMNPKIQIKINDYNSISIFHELTRSYKVEIYKEFIGYDNIDLITFNPLMPTNSVICLVTRDTKGEYSIHRLDYKIINYTTGEEKQGSYDYINEVKINLLNFTHDLDYNGDVIIKVYSLYSKNYIIKQLDEIKINDAIKHQTVEFQNFIIYVNSDERLLFSFIFDNIVIKKEVKINSIITDTLLNVVDESLSFAIELSPNIQIGILSLPRPLKKSERGLILRVFENCSSIYKGDPISLMFLLHDSEKYGLIQFETNVINVNSSLVCIIKISDKIIPFCDYKNLDNEHILIFLNSFTFIENKYIRFVFRRLSKEDKIFNVNLISVFIFDKELFCDKGIVFKNISYDFGCIEQYGSIPTDISYGPKIDFGFTKKTIYGNNFKIATYEIKNISNIPKSISIAPLYITFPPDSSSQWINLNEVKLFHEKLKLYCDRCKKINIYYKNHLEEMEEIIKNDNNSFEFTPKFQDDILLIAVCNTEKDIFCEIKQSFSYYGLCLLKYKTNEGIEEVYNERNINNRLLSNCKSQIINNKHYSIYYKKWPGEIQIVPILRPNHIRIKVKGEAKKIIKLKLYFGKMKIPFSFNKFKTKIGEFYRILGLGDKIMFGNETFLDKNGDILVRGDCFKKSHILIDEFSKLVDIPKDYILSCYFENKLIIVFLLFILFVSSIFILLSLINYLSKKIWAPEEENILLYNLLD